MAEGTSTKSYDKTYSKVKCPRCQNDVDECELLEVKELPCKHYCHSVCLVIYHGQGKEAHCSCGHRIPGDWLKKTVDEIKAELAQFGIYYFY